MTARDTGRPLTGPQLELLGRAVREGTVRLNGRARLTVQRLESRGLVEVDWDVRFGAGPSGQAEFQAWDITVTPTLAGYALAQQLG